MPSTQPSSPSPFPRLSIAHIEGTARSVRYRQRQFQRLHESLVRNKNLLVQTLVDGCGFSNFEALFEFSLSLLELRHHYDNLDLATELAASKAIENSKQNASRLVGTGIVYIIPQIGVFSVLSPLCAALAAGNCVILELQPTTATTSSALLNILPDALDHDVFAIAKDRPDEFFMRQCTVVVQSCPEPHMAYQNLIYSPSSSSNFVYVDRTADLDLAARSIIAARFGFNGTSSYAPDAIFVHEAVLSLLSSYLIPAANSKIGLLNRGTKASRSAKGSDERSSPETPFLISLVKTENASLLFSSQRGAIVQTDDSSLLALLQSKLMAKPAIPLLLLCSVTSMDTAIDLAGELDLYKSTDLTPAQNPSAAFIFASPADAQYLANSVNADLTCVNNFPAQLMVGPKLPKSASFNIVNYNLIPRYGRDMFEEHRVVIPRQSSAAKLLGDAVIVTEEKEGRKRLLEFTEAMLMPMKPNGQGKGTRDDIFFAGLMLSASIVLVPLAVGLGYIGRVAIHKLTFRLKP